MFIISVSNQMTINLLLKTIKNPCLQNVQNNEPFCPICLKQSSPIPIEDSPSTIEIPRSPGKSCLFLKMRLNLRKATPIQLQFLIWVFVLLLTFFTYLPDGLGMSAAYAAINTFAYAIIIYGNISFLFPRLYLKGKTIAYLIITPLAVFIFAVGRAYVTLTVHNY